jgi:predicted alpha-1,6-mannanase (GH76 family)
VRLPGDDPAAAAARRTAGGLITRSADAAWTNAAFEDGLPIFGPDWSRPAIRPRRAAKDDERDLSVQLSGWMLLESAHLAATAD